MVLLSLLWCTHTQISMNQVRCGDDFSNLVWWVRQNELGRFIDSLMNNIPRIIGPLVDIIKDYTGLHVLFSGLHLHCYDQTHHLRPATIIILGTSGLAVKFDDGGSNPYDALWVREYNHRLVGDHLVQWTPQNDHTRCKNYCVS